MIDAQIANGALIDRWADGTVDTVALHLCQELLPVEGKGAVIFPPTYAQGDGEKTRSPYTIDTLADGTRVAQIDTVGSQANRMEPLFLKAKPGRSENPLAKLVPQIEIDIGNERTVSLLEVGHRLGDAIVRASELAADAKDAFAAYRERGDASLIAKLAPTTLVFGAWDSRGEGAKLPRLVNATIRAWDVDKLTRSAQYFPPIDYSKHGVVSAEEQKEAAEGNPKAKFASRGLVAVPSVGVPGGVVAHGPIQRDVTVNFVALRQLNGENGEKLRRYILALALLAAATPQEGFLRQGCLLTLNPDKPSRWESVARSGQRSPLEIEVGMLEEYAARAASAFGVGADRRVKFQPELAKKDLARDDGAKAKKKGGVAEAAAS